MKFKLTTLLIFAAITSFAQFGEHEKLDYSFEIDKVDYMVFEKLVPSDSKIDTTFFTLYRIGNDKLLATEIKKVVDRNTGEILKSGYYNIGKKSITFFLIGEKAPYLQRVYTHNSKGLLILKTSYVAFLEKQAEKPKYIPEPVAEVEIVGDSSVNSPPALALTVDVAPVKSKIDVDASYPGGEKAMYAFLDKNVKYSADAPKNNTNGRVVASFMVEADGYITNIQLNQKLGYGFDKEIIRVIKLMPKWIPAQSDGKPIRSNCFIPITFKQ